MRRGIAHALSDERFVFMKNFNEFFIALGVVLLGVGLWARSNRHSGHRSRVSGHLHRSMWGLAEYLTAQAEAHVCRASCSPSSSFVVLLAAFVLTDSLADERMTQCVDAACRLLFRLSRHVGCTAVLLAFRLPFRIAAARRRCVASVSRGRRERFVGLPDGTRSPSRLFLMPASPSSRPRNGFDMSDRERLTRRSDCAFWLTLIAAPLIVHPVAGLISSGEDADHARPMLLTIAVVVVFALVALIVDRRAFLVSSLAYLGGAIVSCLHAGWRRAERLWITLVVMGVERHPARRRLARARRAVMQFVAFRRLPGICRRQSLMSNP